MNNLFLRNDRADTIFEVRKKGVDKSLVGGGVAKDTVFDAILESEEDLCIGLKIHISDPEWIEVRTATPFERAGIFARDLLVEFVHGLTLVFCVRAEYIFLKKVLRKCLFW